MLERFWAKARIASIISLIFLTLGLVISPWSLVLVLIVAFCGPLIGKIQPIKQTFISKIKKNDWKKIALVLTLILLAFNQEGGGLGFLILALIPIGWAALTDRSIFKNNSKDTSTVNTGNTDQEKSITQVTESRGPLKGQELLAKVKELGDVSKSDLVKACGYVSQKEDGSERLNFTAFYEALLEAKGVALAVSSKEDDEDQTQEQTTSEVDNQEKDLETDWDSLDDDEVIEKLKEKDLPKEIFSHFVDSENWEIRQAIASNQQTPFDVIEQLREDDDEDVQDAVTYRELPEEWRVLDNDEKVEKLNEDENIDIFDIILLINIILF